MTQIGRMVRRPRAARRLASALAFAAAVFLGLGAPVAGAQAAVRADASNYAFDSFDAEYRLSKDRAGRSVLDVTETLVAEFPQGDQNHGIVRSIPLDYDGHSVDLAVQGVADESGAPLRYSSDRSDGFEVLKIGDPGVYVHGRQVYVIRYRMHNVTHRPANESIDEFYWDVNGTGWDQPFAAVAVKVEMSPEVAAASLHQAACYQGAEGASARCESLVQQGDGPVQATATRLDQHETLTVAVAFRDGTFVPRDDSLWASPLAAAGLGGAVVALAAGIAAIVARATRWRNARGRGIVVAQYEPQPGISVMTAADLLRKQPKAVTATILDLAVHGVVRVVETGHRHYVVEYAGVTPPDDDAAAVLTALYGGVPPAAGARKELRARDSATGQELFALGKRVKAQVIAAGLRRRPSLGARTGPVVVALAGTVLACVGMVAGLADTRGGLWPVAGFVVALVAFLVTAVVAGAAHPFTAAGRDAADHLHGLELYIRLAEADRLKMLQSPTGALRGAGEVLRLNERLLPYAVLFGLEREWSQVLAVAYEQQGADPGWYAGQSAFQAAYFAAGIHSFTTMASSAWSTSNVSSSSSGSSGGGFAGGGGGGGGGGGW